MKILLIHCLADRKHGGGAEEIVWSQMQGMRDLGHECVLLAPSDQPGLRQITIDGFPVWLAGMRNIYRPFGASRPGALKRMLWHGGDSYNFAMQPYIREVLAVESPDIAVVHNLVGWSAAALVTLHRRPVPIVQVLHDPYFVCPKSTMNKGGTNCETQCLECRLLRLPHRRLSRLPDAVVGVSRYILDRHLSLGFFAGNGIKRVIYNARSATQLGITTTPMAKTLRNFRFGFIGRLSPPKGVENLLAAFKIAQIPDTELWIAGSGDSDYETKLHALGQSSSIRWLGRVKPAEFYPQVDAVVVPSIWNDTLPTVVFEALAFGKPVIGARRGGIPEMITEGENGLLIEPTDLNAVAAVLRQVTAEPDLLARLASHAAPSAAKFLDMAGWTQQYVSLFEEVMAQYPERLRAKPVSQR